MIVIMIKIWGKLIAKEKIAKSVVIEIDEETTTFFDMLKTISTSLNISTPVLLDKHVHDFNRFHVCEFNSTDFIESIVFDKFVLQLMRGER